MAQQFWVPHPTEVWGVAVEASGGDYKLWKAFDSSTDSSKLTFTPSAKEKGEIKPIVDPKGLQGVDNICDLSDVSEASLLQTLRQRYKERQIYTNVGRIVLSLNPFEYLPLYGEEFVFQYMLSEDPYCLQPHVYQVSAAALQSLREDGKPQAALITGESGAGKTETTKIILQFLATTGGRDGESGGAPAVGSIQQRVLEANPVLEAFGNASTSRNPNSSRFGKWVEVLFNEKYNVIGARVTSYLLEVPRVIGHTEGERNYHVFYQIFEGLKDSLKGLQGQYQLGTDPSDFKFLQPFAPSKTSELHENFLQKNRQKCYKGIWNVVNRLDPFKKQIMVLYNDTTPIDPTEVKDGEGLEELKHALQTLGFRASQQNDLFSIVAAVLHLGNIQFIPYSGGGGDGSQADPNTAHHLSSVASLLGVPEEDLVQILVSRFLKTGNELIKTVLIPEKAQAARDGFAQLTYSCLFSWLIGRVNESLQPSETAQTERNVIGILDIAGFESFKTNGFEQLCINLSNEKLQHHFNQDIFLNEISDYQKDGLKDLKLAYQDNADILDLIEGKGGIFDVLDEELFVPRGSEQNFVSKLAKARAGDKRLIPSKTSGSLTFSVNHYAGTVAYNATSWLQKNQSALPAEAVTLLSSSSNEIMTQAMKMLSGKSASQGTGKGKSRNTVASDFKRQLKDLIERIERTRTHYVRCVKPNKQHVPLHVCSEDILSQLICSGVMEAVRIRKAGFALRLPHGDFVSRYGILLGKQTKTLKGMQPKAAAEALVAHIITTLGLSQDACLVGNSKVFCKDFVQDSLESNRRICLAAPVILIQRHVRGFLVRRRVAEVLELSRQLRVFVTAMEQAKKQGGSFLSPSPVFPDASDAKQLMQKASELHAIVTKCEALGQNLEPPVLSPAKRTLAKMSAEGTLTLNIQSLLENLLTEDSQPLAELVTQAQSKGISNPIIKRAGEVVDRIAAEHDLMSLLTPALESQDLATLGQLIAKAEQLRHEDGFLIKELAQCIDCAQRLLSAPPPGDKEESQEIEDNAALEASLTLAHEQQRRKSEFIAQNEILKQTVQSFGGGAAQRHLSAIKSFMQSRESEEVDEGKAKRVQARRRTQSFESSYWSDSDSDDEITAYYKFFEEKSAETPKETLQKSQNLQKFLQELSRATAQCDVDTLQFLLSRAGEAGIPPGQRELRIAEQQLQNLSDPNWLECELRELIILLSWGSASQADISKLANLIKQGHNTPGVKRDILVSAENTEKAVAEPEFGINSHDNAGGFYALENYPELAINLEIKKTKSTTKLERLLVLRDALLTYQSEGLTEPLLPLPNPLDREALSLFRKLQCLMGDRFSVGHNYEVDLLKTAATSEPLRDEVYVQLLKQLRGNSNSRSVRKGYSFLATLCESCPPSPSLDRYVRHVLETRLGSAGGAALYPGFEGQKGRQQHVQTPQGFDAAEETRLQAICAEALRVLELNKSRDKQNSTKESQWRKERKSTFEINVFLADGSRRKVPLELHAKTNALCSGTAASLNLHSSEEWAIGELLPCYLLKPCRSGLEPPPFYRLLPPDEPVLPLLENASREVTLVFRRPFLRLKENVAPHPTHSRLTCHQAISDHLNYPLDEQPEILAEIAAKIAWYKASLQSRSSGAGAGSSKWPIVAEGIPSRLQSLLPPHRWVALYEQQAQELEPDESEYVKMNSLFSSLKKLKVFGGVFFLCDPFELKVQHLTNSPHTINNILAATFGNSDNAAAKDMKAAQKAIETLIDNSLYRHLMPPQQRAGAGQLSKLLCPCFSQSQGVGGMSSLRRKAANANKPQKNIFIIQGACWLGFGEARIVLQRNQNPEDKDKNKTPQEPQAQSLAAFLNGNSLTSKPEDVGPSFAAFCSPRAAEKVYFQLVAAFALDSFGGTPDLFLLLTKRETHGPRLCAFVTEVDARDVLEYLIFLYPQISAGKAAAANPSFN